MLGNTGLLLAGSLATVLLLVAVPGGEAVCCWKHEVGVSGQPLLTRCWDCTRDNTYCGVGDCNIFGCNCDGGCRRGKCNKDKFITTWQLIRGKRDPSLDLCSGDEEADDTESEEGETSKRMVRADNEDTDYPEGEGSPSDVELSFVFQMADKDGDGFIDLDEAVDLLSQGGVENIEEEFYSMDKDGDQKLSMEELESAT